MVHFLCSHESIHSGALCLENLLLRAKPAKENSFEPIQKRRKTTGGAVFGGSLIHILSATVTE